MDTRQDTSTDGVAALKAYLAQGLIGHELLIERLLIALFAGGHLLVEGAPGLAKTRAVKWLSDAVVLSQSFTLFLSFSKFAISRFKKLSAEAIKYEH